MEDLDVGVVETMEEYEKRKSRYKNNEDDKPLNLKKINFVKGEVVRSGIRIAEFVPFCIDYDNLKSKKTIGMSEPKPSERFKKPKEQERFKGKVWCRKCDEYGHHTDSCDGRLRFKPFHVPDGTVLGQNFVLYKQMYDNYLGPGTVGNVKK